MLICPKVVQTVPERIKLKPNTSCFPAFAVGVTPFAHRIVDATLLICTALTMPHPKELCERMTFVEITLPSKTGTFVKFAVILPAVPLT